MSTKTGKTFGLALIMAVGILAVLFALGTFSSQQAGAATSGVSLSVDDTKPGAEDVEVTVKFTDSEALSGGATPDPDEIVVVLTGFTVTTDSDVDSVTVSGTDSEGEDVMSTITSGNGTIAVDTTAAVVEDPNTDAIEAMAAFTTVTITLSNDIDDVTDGDQPLTFKANTEITLVFADGIDNPDTPVYAMATVDGEESNEVGLGVHLDVSPKGAGAAARVIVEIGTEEGLDTAGAEGNNLEEIVIDMGSFGLPPVIDIDDVSLRGLASNGMTETMRGTPDDVQISGSMVTITVDDMDQRDETAAAGFQGLSPHFRIIFERSAGITVPTTSGSYSVKVVQVTDEAREDTPYDPAVASNAIMVAESLSIKPDKGPTGTEVTVTGKGFGSDITSLFIDTVRQIDDPADDGDMIDDPGTPDGKPENDEHEIATTIDVDKGTFSYTFTVDSNFSDVNYINVLKANGTSYRTGAHNADDNAYPTFTVTGKISLSTVSAKPGQEITVTLANFSEGRASATIGGQELFPSEGTDGSDDIEAVIPVDLTIGKHQIKVTVVPTDGGDDETGTADITVEGLPLDVSPTSAVPGQDITIKGSGFTKQAKILVIMVGGETADLPDTSILVNSSGNFVANIEIPDSVTDEGDDVLVEVRESDTDADPNPGNNRQGVARITIPKETLTLNPETSRPDTTVVASGTGYVAGAVVEIEYDGKTVVSVNADSTGNWTKAFVVPTDKPVGNEYTVKAVGDNDVAAKSASETHTIPGGGLTVSPLQGRPGTSVSITGDGFTAYRPVSSITVGGLGVLTGIINTDADGDFSATILLPALPEGTHSLVVKVGDDTESVVFTVGEAGAAVLPTGEVFKALIDADNLERVYHYVNATAEWLVYDPRPDFAEFNDYTESTSGQAVWVKVTNAAQFQGEPLFAGWNLIVLR